MDLYEPVTMSRATVNGRNVWHFIFRTTVGDFHLVEHEAPGLELIDDYLGRSEQKAGKAYDKAVKKVLKGD